LRECGFDPLLRHQPPLCILAEVAHRGGFAAKVGRSLASSHG
jgi:hypothetical protein